MDAANMTADLAELRDCQLESWPMARANYELLGMTERRLFKIGALKGALQFNPARRVSTGAIIDADVISRRPCFLCGSNRPPEQTAEVIVSGWDFLVNPYPIFPLHFTIASDRHIPQMDIPIEMASMAERLPGMTVFFNGAHAGASAPDHLHCQAVMTSELPLMSYLEGGGEISRLPFKVHYDIITPDVSGMIRLHMLTHIGGKDGRTGNDDPLLVNAYMWLGADSRLRVAVVPRAAHRPSCYTAVDETSGFMVSPGAIDMAGVIILPRRNDFEAMTDTNIRDIYSEVALPAIDDSSDIKHND